ncbi:conjugal transfer protein TraC [Rhizobium sp. RAF56]|uniref:conjugal transfer protein TraC n=1 Tax=Rhizobium sp. RAF56 TaxID=3233062 RepID=UPI003F9A5EF6
MKKPAAKIREEIARLQEQLKLAETRDAERIGRIALRAGLGEIEIEEADLLSAFEEVAGRFRGETKSAHGRETATTPPNGAREAAGQSAEA